VIGAYILIQTDASTAFAVAAALRELPGVAEAASLAVPYDVIAGPGRATSTSWPRSQPPRSRPSAG
jgi:hypothetical protein